MTLRLVIAEQSRTTGRLLAEAIRSEGGVISPSASGVVSYGVRLRDTGLPTLNENAGMADKFEQLRTLRNAGVPTPQFYSAQEAVERATSLPLPMLGRKAQHRAGRDIMLVLQKEDIPWRVSAGAEFFTTYIPTLAEFRIWVFRRQHLGTYTKGMAHPEQYKRVGRNHKNGFAFSIVPSEEVPRGAVDIAVLATRALGLDFAAIDILQGTDQNYYVLEANTAPGVDASRMVLRSLARKIVRWEQSGFPSRRS